MKIEDMVMVIYNHKGTEKNFLCSFETFIKQHAKEVTGLKEIKRLTAGLWGLDTGPVLIQKSV